MANSAASKVERIVGSFASLMSSALSLSSENGAKPLKNSSDVLPKFISPTVGSDNVCMVIPSLLLKHGETSTSNGASLEESAALNLSRPVDVSAKQIEAAPIVLLANFCDSFTSLVDSRLRSSIQALVRQSHMQKDATLTRVLVGLLACAESPIAPSAVVTSFRTLAACELTPNGEIVMPMVMEAIVDLKIFGNLVSVTIVAPGTITTTFANDFLISRSEIVLDTLSCLQSMMKQARFAVRKAVATASNLATNLLIPSSLPGSKPSASNNNDMDPAPHSVSSSQNLKQLLAGRSMMAPSKATPASAPSAAPPAAPESSSSLMPPPPSRPSKRSLADLAQSSTSDLNNGSSAPSGGANATWGAPPASGARERAIASGLSLLTAAAGMNNNASTEGSDTKRQRTDDYSRPRKVTSCPRLEAAV